MTRAWPFGDLVPLRYGAIYADPPWRFHMRSDKGRDRCPDAPMPRALQRANRPERHYPTMELDAIKALPVHQLAAPRREGSRRHLLHEEPDHKLFPMGTGYWTRPNVEQCLLFTLGEPKRLAADVRKLTISPRREHSRKPDEIYGRIERLVAGPYAELFARTPRPGWHSWGNEIPAQGLAA